MALLDEQFILRDDLDQSTKRETTEHVPLDAKDSLASENGDDKRQGNALIFEEQFNVYLNVPKHVRSTRRNVYLVIQILEINEKQIMGDNSMIKGSKFQVRGWYIHKINEPNGKVNPGTFEEYIYAPPQKRPPVNKADLVTLSQTLEFSIEELTGTTTRKG